ncbi:allantoinase AllB [Streptomyces acidiscabies]|uniref:allantoinase n=1 Tax=Streptomyces acidiscabies TaxID=42234 RepID=A0AAP6B980_9ACTN|nr:allantoinase AllB [Streptomyces acidiscabies]MBP5935980.1 allantoinase AllB [Streptomyces sp. LBUM 1476]MBZ3916101.1 allantoinase AllB [Streptomyces acidiscabies]MDX2960493.1 allantoinase AllB [Streptomyces acidiscabies]MDX3017779.1 allantoinase AllB [Streptomyces acidiscabies]MDX3794292.1 allantoinase AllB [Streptomyces acidiscabies]
MSEAEWVLRSTRVVTPEGERAAAIAVAGGVITAVLPYDAPLPPGARVEDVGDHVVLPGLVDTHVHVNDPGRTHWEGFWTATRAAAAGGITTLVDMPLNSLPPTTTVEHLDVKRKVAADKAHMDVGFWGGALPDNTADLRPLHDAGVFGFKAFLSPSGVDEFPHLDREHLARALEAIAAFDGLLIVHAEDPHHLETAPQQGGPKYADFLASRPRHAEDTAIAHLLEEAKRLHARVHVLHLSSSDALPLIARAKADGVRVTVETCPHYLTLTAEEVPDGASEFKCCPPIREAANQDLLWQALADGTIDCVVTDHSPSTADLKTDDFATAWGGISGLQLSLSAVWTAARARGHTLDDVVRWMSSRTAALVGLDGRKGAIAPGHDADFAVLAPDETFTVDPEALQHRNRVTAYAGRTLYGVVKSTWLRGERIHADGKFTAPKGRLLTRDH